MTLTDQYAEAIIESTRSADVETILKRVRIVLKKNGHTKLLHNILRKVVELSENSGTKVEYRVAKKEEAALYIEELKKNGITVSEDSATVDESLVGGFLYRDDKCLIDGSHKRALINLYTKITQ